MRSSIFLLESLHQLARVIPVRLIQNATREEYRTPILYPFPLQCFFSMAFERLGLTTAADERTLVCLPRATLVPPSRRSDHHAACPSSAAHGRSAQPTLLAEKGSLSENVPPRKEPECVPLA